MVQYPDGRRYEGFHKLDKRHGYGIYETPDGSVYSGSWYGGKQHGYANIYIKSSGESKYGVYKQGQRLFKITAEQAMDI